MHSYQSLGTSLILVKWLKIKETGAIKPEKPFKRLRDKRLLADRLNTQSLITSFLPSENLHPTYFLRS